MAWIRWIDDADAEGDLAQSYEDITRGRGPLDHILKIHSLNPPSLDGHYDFYKKLMFGRSPLSRPQREMIAVAVSAANECHY